MPTKAQHHAMKVYRKQDFTFHDFFILGPDQLHAMTALTAFGTALCSHFTGNYHVSTSKLASQSGQANRNNP
jgi:hypothetical protein